MAVTVGSVAGMERIAGHPAIDFVNTLGGLPDHPDDEFLFDYADLLTWTEDSGLLAPRTAGTLRRISDARPKAAGEAFDRALRLRAALDEVLRRHLDGRPARMQDRVKLREAYCDAIAHADLQPSADRYAWTWSTHTTEIGLELPLWLLAFHAVELLRFAALDRLTQCAHCRWLFLDLSKNRSRRWCSMNACGGVMKMRRYRAARRPLHRNLQP
jgi:predicted RNA-binding Zn ribbon-like protein